MFFKEKISLLNDPNITVHGFHCFKSLFCLINEKQNKLGKVKKVEKRLQYTEHLMNGYQWFEEIDSDDEWDSDIEGSKKDFEYKSLVGLSNLDGIFSIWNFVFTAKNPDVVKFAIDFLAGLYVNVSDQIKDQQ